MPHSLRLEGDVLIASPSAAIAAYHRPAHETSESGLAVDITWTPGRRLTLLSGGSVVAIVEVANHGLRLTIADQIR